MNKKTVAVFFGSRSPEHDVSIITAISVIIKPLELSGSFDVVPVYIAKDGAWYCDERLKDVSLYSSGKINDFLAKSKPVQIVFDGGLTLVKPGVRSQKIKVDIGFPATHGANGEDGALMGVLRMANIPFVGCDIAASAIAMDKAFAKQVARAAGISTPQDLILAAQDFTVDSEAAISSIHDQLTLPVFVKPAHLGSSIGISKVDKWDNLVSALEVAFHYDDKVLVEQAVDNLIEVTVPIMGNETLTPALVEQPLTSGDNFFDFETKYMNGGKKSGGKQTGAKQGAQGYSKLPADLPDDLMDKSLEIAQKIYSAIGCSGIARVDLLIDSKAGEVYFNEINPLPGSLYAHNWREAGVSTVDLVTKLVALAEERYEKQQRLNSVFQTNFLKQF